MEIPPPHLQERTDELLLELRSELGKDAANQFISIRSAIYYGDNGLPLLALKAVMASRTCSQGHNDPKAPEGVGALTLRPLRPQEHAPKATTIPRPQRAWEHWPYTHCGLKNFMIQKAPISQAAKDG